MKKVLVIGATGLVGSRFVELTKDKLDIISVDETKLDITNKESVEKFFDETSFDTVLNLAAYTDVAKAESERNNENGLCFKLNALAPKYLNESCKKHNRFLVHISTDFVFEGLENSKGPFDEDQDLPETNKNLSWYGWTKNRGETGDAIVRIANPFRNNFPQKLDFARKILDLYDKNSLFPLFTDQIITPIYVDEMVSPLLKIINEKINGKFHIVSSDTCSYYDLANYLIEIARGVKDYPRRALLTEFLKDTKNNKRPIWGGLATKKTQEKLGMKFKTWKEMVDEFILYL